MRKVSFLSISKSISLPTGKTGIFLLFLATTLFLYLPILINPQTILQRGNDLQEYYWPVYYYVKQQILQNHIFPLWNTMFFSGTPLVADPQSPQFYLPNIIFLIFPMNLAFIIGFILHTFFAGLAAYITARKGFGLSRTTSIITGLLYMLIPRTSGFLVEGHYGPFALFTWLPLLVFSVVMLIKKPQLGWSLLFAVSLAATFFTFPTMGFSAAIISFAIVFAAGCFFLTKRSYQTSLFLLAGTLITFGLTAIAFLPQLEWLPHSTRFILLNNPDVYPKWNSKIEFIKALYPHLFGQNFINSLDNEKWIASGVLITVLAFIGLLQLKRLFKFLIALTIIGVSFVSLNNASPIYSLLLSTDWYVLGRVSTRVWFVIVPLVTFLAGFGFEKLVKSGRIKLAFTLAFLALGELIIVSWLRFQTPAPPQKHYASSQVLNFFKTDPSLYRVFCVNRCLSQKDVAIYNLETVEGYGTIYQKNYYDQFIQLSQVFWDKYSSVLPPFEIYNTREIQPYSPEVGDYNVKYIIAPYTLKDKNFEMVGQIDNYFIYKNKIARGRAYFLNGKDAPIIQYLPNYIKIDTTNHKTNELVIAEVYSPGWTAKLDGNKETDITETKNRLRMVNISKDTQFVELYYYPKSYQIGKFLTIFTIFAIIITSYHLSICKHCSQRPR